MILERTLFAERTGFWHYDESLLGSLEFTEENFSCILLLFVIR